MDKMVKNSSQNTEKLVETVSEIIGGKENTRGRTLVAIDGRCASGKTTLAAGLKQRLSCEVIHMDHFFLRPEQRSAERFSIPGGNIDHERFLQEVLIPLKKGEAVVYRPFDCKRMELGEPISVAECGLYIVEGAYSCHPSLREYYDLCIFMDVDSKEQMRRIVFRNGQEAAEMFASKWIPLEEQYIDAYEVADWCDYVFRT